jgi:predicted nucleic acid-binding protein
MLSGALRLQVIDHLIGNAVHVLEMTNAELDVFERLTAEHPDDELGLVLPLGAGEAACVAIALERGHVLATDDADALRALHRLRPDHPNERIRRLLVRAGTRAIITRKEANHIHQRMREMGFWDTVAPFPEER